MSRRQGSDVGPINQRARPGTTGPLPPPLQLDETDLRERRGHGTGGVDDCLADPSWAAAWSAMREGASVSDDFEMQGSSVCPRLVPRDPFPLADARIVGPPTSERSSGAVVTIEPPADLFVPFAATEDGAEIGGTIEVSFGAGDCVQTYSVSRTI